MFLLGEMENSEYLESKMSQVINTIAGTASYLVYLFLATCRN